jgi:hypothetical protein
MFSRLRQYATGLRFFRTIPNSKLMPRMPFTSNVNSLSALTLPVIDRVASDLRQNNQLPNAKNTFFVLAQHLLTTTTPFIAGLINHLGAETDRVFVVGKRYSNNQRAIDSLKSLGVYVQPSSEQIGLDDFIPAYTLDINKMWDSVEGSVNTFHELHQGIKPTVIVGDDGGYLLGRTPKRILEICNVIGFEQTMSGKEAYTVPYPVIMPATSIKQSIEPPMVAKVVLTEVLKTLPETLTNPRFGILGFGAMGQALYKILPKDKALIYDKDPHKRTLKRNSHVTDLAVFIAESDVIICCSGTDSLSSMVEYFGMTRQPKYIINAASASELLSLLQYVQSKNRNGPLPQLSDISFKNSVGTKHIIAYGGCPINFRPALTTGESVPAHEIQFTRGLLFASVVQALHAVPYFENRKDNAACYQLDPYLQAKVATAFFAENPTLEKEYGKAANQVQNVNWIRENTGGTPMPSFVGEQNEQPSELTL